jgi:hypothetical protein
MLVDGPRASGRRRCGRVVFVDGDHSRSSIPAVPLHAEVGGWWLAAGGWLRPAPGTSPGSSLQSPASSLALALPC